MFHVLCTKIMSNERWLVKTNQAAPSNSKSVILIPIAPSYEIKPTCMSCTCSYRCTDQRCTYMHHASCMCCVVCITSLPRRTRTHDVISKLVLVEACARRHSSRLAGCPSKAHLKCRHLSRIIRLATRGAVSFGLQRSWMTQAALHIVAHAPRT